MRIRTELLPEITVSALSRLRDVLNFSPAYQREGGVWNKDTKAGLIDSIINRLDMPKLYFEKMTERRLTTRGLTYQYAVIDGKQRLEAITSFLDGKLTLSEDFRFFEDESIKAGGLSLNELKNRFPPLYRRFMDYELPIVNVTSDSGDLIEEMFQRLNASSSLNAAERRNAVSGATRASANKLAEHLFLVDRSPIKNARFKYRELGAKFLAIENQLTEKGKLTDTKADTLHRLFLATHGDQATITDDEMAGFQAAATAVLDKMLPVFNSSDPLLASIGTVVVYYLVFRDAADRGPYDREKFQEFEELRRAVTQIAEGDADYSRRANARLREYNVFVQSTNDGRALQRRAQILHAYVSEADGVRGFEALDRLDETPVVPEFDEQLEQV